MTATTSTFWAGSTTPAVVLPTQNGRAERMDDR